jgi:hypothetical protein
MDFLFHVPFSALLLLWWLRFYRFVTKAVFSIAIWQSTDIFLWVRKKLNSLAEIRTHDTWSWVRRSACYTINASLWNALHYGIHTYHVCPWTSGSFYVSKLTTNLPGLPYGYTDICLTSKCQYRKTPPKC